MYRYDIFFADKWISYYGRIFGYEHVYLFVDGTDQKLPKKALKINWGQVKRIPGDAEKMRGGRKII